VLSGGALAPRPVLCVPMRMISHLYSHLL
jgi:hypothetical protein